MNPNNISKTEIRQVLNIAGSVWWTQSSALATAALVKFQLRYIRGCAHTAFILKQSM
jgi:hypothetical protein